MTTTEHLDRPEFLLGQAHESIASVPAQDTIVIIEVKDDTEVSKAIGSFSAISRVCSQIHGPVSISKMRIRWLPLTKGCQLKYVVYSAAASVNKLNYAQRPNASGEVSTEMRHGEWKTFELNIPQGLASQIQPVSGQFPPPALFIYSKGSAECYVDVFLNIGGQRFIFCEDF